MPERILQIRGERGDLRRDQGFGGANPLCGARGPQAGVLAGRVPGEPGLGGRDGRGGELRRPRGPSEEGSVPLEKEEARAINIFC